MTQGDVAPQSRGAAIWLGVVIALAGVVLLLWPGVTILVLVWALGLAIAVYGIHELVAAFSGAGERSRLWAGIIGVVAVIGGVAIILTPIVSSITVGLVIGWYWLIGGAVGIAGAIIVPGDRLVRGLVAVLSVLAGLVVITQPGLSLVALVWFSGFWMLIAGLIIAGSALFSGRRGAVRAA